GGDYLDLVGIGVERIAFGDPPDFAVVGTDQLEGPFRTGGDGLSFHTAFLSWPCVAERARGTPDRYPRHSPIAAGRKSRQRLRPPGCIRTTEPDVRAG